LLKRLDFFQPFFFRFSFWEYFGNILDNDLNQLLYKLVYHFCIESVVVI
jgi:hypothetical protein